LEKRRGLRRNRFFLVVVLAIEIPGIEDEGEEARNLGNTRRFWPETVQQMSARQTHLRSKGKITFQSFFMLITVQPFFCASS
jgi:hypothetical protein